MSPGDLERAIADFRRWFHDAVASNGEPLAAEASPPRVDLATLLGHYVALRQEVNLQTRAVRGQQEQSAEVLRQFGQTIEQLARQQARAEQLERQSLDDKVRPVVMSLIELHDALSLANREIERTEDSVLPLLEEMSEEAEDERAVEAPPSPGRVPARSFWTRWRLSPSAEEQLRASQEEARRAQEELNQERLARQGRAERWRENAQRVSSALAALITGYSMSLERLERALRKHGLEALPAVGEPFDPEQMEALDTVAGTGRPKGEVVEEVRRGYRWNGRIVRYAQVRVARD